MDKLAEELFGHIEIMVLGAFGVGLIAYFLAVYHPFKRWLLDYFAELDAFWFGKTAGRRLSALVIHGVQVGALIGGLYYLGVVANLASYWLIEPVRFKILDSVYSSETARCKSDPCLGDKASDLPLREALTLPILQFSPNYDLNGKSNGLYLRDEAKIDSSNMAQVRETLDEDLTFIRLLRGTILFTLSYAAVSAVKVIVVLLTIPLWARSELSYKRFVDENGNRLAEQQNSFPNKSLREQKLSVAFSKVVRPQLFFMALCVVLYVVAMGSYRAAEFEYSRTVRDAVGPRLADNNLGIGLAVVTLT